MRQLFPMNERRHKVTYYSIAYFRVVVNGFWKSEAIYKDLVQTGTALSPPSFPKYENRKEVLSGLTTVGTAR